MAKILGIDYGKRRIGVALSDETAKVAFPHSVVDNGRDAAAHIARFASDEGVSLAVIGESTDMRGTDNPVMEEGRTFAKLLEAAGLTVVFQQEFFTSVEAHRSSFAEQEKKGKQVVDASAAALILQRFLDKKNNQ